MLNLHYKTSFPKNPNQSRQLTVLTIPDSALCLYAARLYYFHDIKNFEIQNVYDETEMVCMTIRYCLNLKLLCYSKQEKIRTQDTNMDIS